MVLPLSWGVWTREAERHRYGLSAAAAILILLFLRIRDQSTSTCSSAQSPNRPLGLHDVLHAPAFSGFLMESTTIPQCRDIMLSDDNYAR